MREVKEETTFWRDRSLSLRHRAWGFDVPAVDIDFLMIEYDSAEPIAIIEYKRETAAVQWASHPSIKAMIKLADRSEIMAIAVRYSADLSWFLATALNANARKLLPKPVTFSEKGFVKFLYSIRNREVPLEILDKL